MGAAAATIAGAGALGEPSSVSAHSVCGGKPGDEAGGLRQLLATQKADHEVRRLLHTVVSGFFYPPSALLHAHLQRRASLASNRRICQLLACKGTGVCNVRTCSQFISLQGQKALHGSRSCPDLVCHAG